MSTLDAALDLAATGTPVCPTVPDATKRPRPGLGSRTATTDPATIRRWWRRWPDSNLAIATGHTWDVLDVDVKHDQPGLLSLRRAAATGLLDRHGPVVRTPSGGWHLWFAASGQRPGAIRGTGLEFKAAGVLLTVPPSAIDGRPYAYTDATFGVAGAPGDVASLDWPKMRALFEPPTPARDPDSRPKGIDGLERAVRDLQEGNRNNGVWWAMSHAAADGHDPAELEEAALSIGLDRLEVAAIIRSARRVRRAPA